MLKWADIWEKQIQGNRGIFHTISTAIHFSLVTCIPGSSLSNTVVGAHADVGQKALYF